MHRLCSIFFLVGTLPGQQGVAPTAARVGPLRGEDVSGYNVVNSFETGYRFRSVGGDLGKYRSDVNYGNGVRLVASKLTVNSKDGHGRMFDEIVLTTQGLGNDPYQFSSLRIQKNRLYRYDMFWRSNDYVNPGLTIAGGQHLSDTQRRFQDHDLTLLPQSKIRLFLGYTRNSQDGPALTTIQLFDSRGDEFPLFSDIRRVRNEYRLGGEIQLAGVKLNWLRGWDDFKEDTPTLLPAASEGNNPNDRTTLASLRRDEPYHGTTPYWRLNLFTEKTSWAVGGRFAYAVGRRNFVFDESTIGTARFGTARNRQTLIFGSGRRPVASGNLTLSVFPTSRLTFSNQTAFHNTRIEGDSSFREFNNTVAGLQLLFFRSLGIRTITNTSDATFRAAKWLGVYGGYHHSNRRVRSIEQFEVAGRPESLPAEQDNRINSGLVGVRLRPFQPLSINLDGEIGRADRPFFPIAERNYHALGARVQYKAKSLRLSAGARSNYNTNSASLSNHSSRGRNFSFDASWIPGDWFALDAGYSRLHLDTASGIAFFASSQFIEGDRSIYVSNIHAGNCGARLAINRRAELYFGYSHVQDTGDGRNRASVGSGARLAPFIAAQTFPLTYRTPLARLSVRLHTSVRLNFGYQYYNYAEEFSARQNYRAHTGYTSVLWSF
jgi:hypothetical protein